MTENLRLGSTNKTYAIDSTNSDVSSSFTLPIAQSSDGVVWDPTLAHVYITGNSDYGNYYNWLAATAGTGTEDTHSGRASSSICPKNWKLPNSGGNRSWFYMAESTYHFERSENVIKAQASPLSIVLSGRYLYSNGVTQYQATNGLYWTSTPVQDENETRVYIADFTNTYVVTYAIFDRAFGFAVRCVTH